MAELLENGFVKDEFEMGNHPLIYKDAIVMPVDQYNALTADEIAAIKQQRYDNWLAVINSPAQE